MAESAKQANDAETAIYLAPADPSGHAQLATFKTQSFYPDNISVALAEFERAVVLSPNNWRYWYGLARTRERFGDSAGAETAARRAVELAPNNAQVLWLAGNILLRRGQTSEAFTAMRRAAEADAQFTLHFISIAIKTSKTDDFSILRQTIGDSPQILMTLISFLAQEKKLDAALKVWQELPDRNKREAGLDLAKALLEEKKYRAALPFFALLATSEAEKPEIGKFTNGGFEGEIAVKADLNPFVWQIAQGAQPQISSFAGTKHSGDRSLIILFNLPSSAEFRSVSQTVAVEPNATYNFEVFAKTANLKTKSSIYWEVVDAVSGNILTKTAAVAAPNSDWQKLAANFTSSSATEAVTIRLARAACPLPPCPISGKIWFDDFSLQKIK